jgi:hypothetical protein
VKRIILILYLSYSWAKYLLDKHYKGARREWQADEPPCEEVTHKRCKQSINLWGKKLHKLHKKRDYVLSIILTSRAY